MSFKAEITEDYTRLQGSRAEVLMGLAMYVRALLKAKLDEGTIREVVEMAIDDYKNNNKKQDLDKEKLNATMDKISDDVLSILKEIFK